MTSKNELEDAFAMISNLWQYDTLEKAQNLINNDHVQPPVTITNFVSNTFVSRTSDEWIDSFDPKTGKIFARVQNSSISEVEAAIDAATAAFKSWSRTTRAERSKYLQRIAGLIQDNRELFAVWESIDQGKTVERARIEVDRAISNFSYALVHHCIIHQSNDTNIW
jgi:acyl-CoA reductase-like NAD-dependent aldehyde dehydrogenase